MKIKQTKEFLIALSCSIQGEKKSFSRSLFVAARIPQLVRERNVSINVMVNAAATGACNLESIQKKLEVGSILQQRVVLIYHKITHDGSVKDIAEIDKLKEEANNKTKHINGFTGTSQFLCQIETVNPSSKRAFTRIDPRGPNNRIGNTFSNTVLSSSQKF